MKMNMKSWLEAFAALCCVLPALATAELSDPPYWNLWSTAQTINGAQGDGASVTLCGTADCMGDQSLGPNTPNPTPTNKGVAIFSVDTVGPLGPDGQPFFNSAGSGHINPFLRFQHNENQADQPYGGQGSHPSGGVEAAYNTDDRSWDNVRKLQEEGSFVNQAKDANAFNHSIKLGDLVEFDQSGKQTVGGGYFGFWLDVNEPGNEQNQTIVLEELGLFVGSNNLFNKYTPQGPNDDGTEGTLQQVTFDANGDEIVQATATKVWDMDFDQYAPNKSDSACNDGVNPDEGCGGIVVDSQQGSAGSGDFDMKVMLSIDLFAGFSPDSYVYLYNFMGAVDKFSTPDLEASAGFEEWIAATMVPPDTNNVVSAPGTVGLMSLGLLGLLRRRRD